MVPGDFYDKNGKHIGSDGIDDKKKYVVFDKNEAKTISDADKKGKKTSANNVKDKATINGGCATIEGVVASVNAEESNTYNGSHDAGLHEEGGDARKGADGNMKAELWDSGPKIAGKQSGEIKPFGGVAPFSSLNDLKDNLADMWHIHTSGTTTSTTPEGQTEYNNPLPGPSNNDLSYQAGMQIIGFKGTAIQVDTYGSKTVNFYDSKGITGSMSFNAFKKMGDN